MSKVPPFDLKTPSIVQASVKASAVVALLIGFGTSREQVDRACRIGHCRCARDVAAGCGCEVGREGLRLLHDGLLVGDLLLARQVVVTIDVDRPSHALLLSSVVTAAGRSSGT